MSNLIHKSYFENNIGRILLPLFSLVLIFHSGLGLTQERNSEITNLSTIYLDAIADEMFDEADQIAKQIVEQSIQIYGLDSHESANALIKLAMAQQGHKDYELAILNYESAIVIIERIENRLNKDLINPLKGLAEAPPCKFCNIGVSTSIKPFLLSKDLI